MAKLGTENWGIDEDKRPRDRFEMIMMMSVVEPTSPLKKEAGSVRENRNCRKKLV